MKSPRFLLLFYIFIHFLYSKICCFRLSVFIKNTFVFQKSEGIIKARRNIHFSPFSGKFKNHFSFSPFDSSSVQNCQNPFRETVFLFLYCSNNLDINLTYHFFYISKGNLLNQFLSAFGIIFAVFYPFTYHIAEYSAEIIVAGI